MTSEIRIGIVGYGSIGRCHSRAIQNVRGAKLVSVADVDMQRMDDLPQKVQRFADYNELLLTDIDAVIICSPTAFHSEASLNALMLGKHVLVEKPIAANVDEARKMCRVAREQERVLLVGMTHRFYPEFRRAKRLVDEGAIGDVLMCTDKIIEPIGFNNLPAWYMDKGVAGGGVVMSDGVHLVDRNCWFTGATVRQVAGVMGNRYLSSSIEDFAQLFFWFHGGATAQLTMAFMNVPHPMVCDLHVIGTKGSMQVHTWQGYTLHGLEGTQSCMIYKDEPHEYRVQVGLKAEIEEFCAAIQDGRDPVPSPEECLKVMETIQAFYTATETGMIISL